MKKKQGSNLQSIQLSHQKIIANPIKSIKKTLCQIKTQYNHHNVNRFQSILQKKEKVKKLRLKIKTKKRKKRIQRKNKIMKIFSI